MADEATEQTLDQQLEELFKEPDAPTSAPEKGAKPEAGNKDQPAASPADPAKPEAPAEEDPLEKALKEIEGEPEPKEEKQEAPQLSTEQKSILAAIPSAEVAADLYQTAQNYSAFTGAFEKRDFASVETMFERWDNDAYEAFLDHIYQKRVASGEWVDRFIAEQEGRSTEHKGIKSLQKKIEQLEGKLTEKDSRTQAEQQKADNARVFEEYKTHVNGLFDKINQAKGDRKYILADLNERLTQHPEVMKAVRDGNLSAVNKLFAQVTREYNKRDQEAAEARDAKIAEQSKKKAPVAGGVGTPGGDELPDDIKQVPKGQEESWMNQQLGKLFKKSK